MPDYGIRVSTGTPDPPTGHHNDAPKFEKNVMDLVAECRGNALVEYNDGDLDLGALDRQLSEPKSLRIDLQTADEKQSGS